MKKILTCAAIALAFAAANASAQNIDLVETASGLRQTSDSLHEKADNIKNNLKTAKENAKKLKEEKAASSDSSLKDELKNQWKKKRQNIKPNKKQTKLPPKRKKPKSKVIWKLSKTRGKTNSAIKQKKL